VVVVTAARADGPGAGGVRRVGATTAAGATAAAGGGSGRTVDYLRLSVTDRCNFRCVYCMPPEGVTFRPHDEILSYEDMAFFVSVAVELGISKVRLTGGEPLVRKGVADLVRLLCAIDGVEDVSLTTNGTLLPQFAADLKAAGLRRVNISLDSLDPVRYRLLSRGGNLTRALAGVQAALDHDLQPVKINAVMLPELLAEVESFVALTRDRPLHVRFIEWMPVGSCGPGSEAEMLSRVELTEAIARLGDLVDVVPPRGFGPAEYSRLAGYQGTLGFISSVSGHFCGDCNRLRLTADGMLRSCLFSDDEVPVRSAVRERDREVTLERIREVLAGKTFDKRIVPVVNTRGMSQIGG
jgi:cyclic pyranopterin phosphate synthase